VAPQAKNDAPAGCAGLSIVLPAYNEADNIRKAVENGLAAAEKLVARHEVIVVDDGSADATGNEVEAMARQHYPRVRLVKHPTNLGYGAALRTGFAHSRYGLVFFTDSDNQFDMSELEGFIPLMADFDLVAGYRINRCDPWQRGITSWFYNRLVRVLFRVDVHDVNCAFKLIRQDVVHAIDIECNDFFVNSELLVKARRLNFKIAEKGVHHHPRTAGVTSVKLSDIPRTIATVVTMWRRLHRANDEGVSRRKDFANTAVSEFIPRSRVS
jgi:glycosyltransferase involved in cell wall biosynthesis